MIKERAYKSSWNLTDKRIYQLLKHPHNVDKSIIDEMSAYMEFVEELFYCINHEKDKKELIRQLNTNYIDFNTLKSLEESEPTENSKLKVIYLDKILSLLDMETELVYRQMENPKFFINIDSNMNNKSPFHLNDEVVNLVDIMEVITGLFNMEGAIYRMDNNEMRFSDFTREFERMLNFSFGNIYKTEESVLKRTSKKITGFLDKIKGVIVKMSKDKGYYHP